MTVFYALEATLYRSYTDPVGPADLVWLGMPWLALCEVEASPSTTSTMRASDVGYRTLATDTGGVVAFPPRIADTISIDVAANLDPVRSSVAAAWGTLTLANTDSLYDTTINAGWITDGQLITIYRGVKTYDTTRQIWVDPGYSTLSVVFAGVMGPWQRQQNQIQLALRDASYYLEKPVPRLTYGGTGRLDGSAGLAGASKPLAYGGDGAFPIQNVLPTLVDTAALIYECAGTAIAVYDGGVALTPGLSVSDLYVGTTTAGQFRVDTVRGLFQLGSQPIYTLTADINGPVTGFGATAVVTLAVRGAMDGFMSVPQALLSGVHLAALNLLATDYPGFGTSGAGYAAVHLQTGIYLAAGEDIDGVTLISRLIGSSGAYLVPGRTGLLRLFVVTPIPVGTTSALTFDNTNIVSIEVQPLPASVYPPPWRLRLAYDHNYTVQTAGLAGATPAARVAWLALADRTATGVTTTPVTTGTPNDPAVIGTGGGILSQTARADVQAVAQSAVAVWGVRRRLYNITVPISVGLLLDWASVVTVVSDFDGLQSPGVQGQIVGWRYRSADGTTMFRVLV